MPSVHFSFAAVVLCLTPAIAHAAPSLPDFVRPSLPDFVRKVQLWNCGGAEPTADGKGVMLYRAPKVVRDALDTTTPDGKETDGAKQMRVAAHSEIRFVLEEGEKLENVKLHLRSGQGPTVCWFWGDILAGEAKVAAGDRTKPITPHGHGLMFSLLEKYPRGRFANRVCRVVVSGLDVEFAGIEGNVRPAMADYLAGLPWDLCVLEISVNMFGTGFTDEQFKERAGAMITKLATSHPDALIVGISLFPIGTGDLWGNQKARTQAYRDALAEVVKSCDHKNVHFVSGPELLSFSGLSPDMLHPTDQGMIEIAAKLAPRIREWLPADHRHGRQGHE